MWVSNPEEGTRRVPGQDDGGGTSERREEEPNDVRSQATLVELGEELAPVQGALESSEDIDWYALTSADGESSGISLEVTPGRETVDPLVRVEVAQAKGGDESPAIVYDVGGEGEKEAVPRIEVGEDVQRIAVASDGGDGDYTLRFRRQLIGGAVETEPNDAREAATLFDFPGEFQGFFDRPDDADWYYALRTGFEPGIYSLQFTPVESLDYTVQIFTRREAPDPYLEVEVPKDGRASIPNVEVPESAEGLWFHLRDGDAHDREASYRIRGAAHPEVEEGVVETEPNGTPERADRMELGETVRGYLHRQGDRDHFNLVVGEPPELVEEERAEVRDVGGTATAETPARDVGEAERPRDTETADAETGGPRRFRNPLEQVERKDPPAHVVQVGLKPERDSAKLALEELAPEKRSRVAPAAGEEVRICNRPVEEDAVLRFAVRAESLAGRGMGREFTYRVAAVDILDQVDFLEVEPNDDRSRADRLPSGRTRTGYIVDDDDRDLYAFGVPRSREREEGSGGRDAEDEDRDTETSSGSGRRGPPETRSVAIDLRGNQLDLELAITDSTGAPVARVDRAGPGANESTELDLPPGLYFVQVASSRGHSCDPYELTVEVEGADETRDVEP